MPRTCRSHRPSTGAVGALVLALGALGCSTPSTAVPSPSGGPPAARTTVDAVRTTVELGPGAVVVAEILEVGDDARATVRTPAGVMGEEILSGDDHYVRMPDAGPVVGGDLWIHTDLSDPSQRRYAERNPAGFVDLADIGELRPGAELAGRTVLAVERPRHGHTVLDLGDGRTVRVVEQAVVDPEPIRPPDPSEVVALVDLPPGR